MKKLPTYPLNRGYVLDRLRRALETAVNHADAATRARAEAKADRWRAVIKGLADGRIDVGSRVPVADTPAWVTLEVAHGGFATGRCLAEGPLLDEERRWLQDLSNDDDRAPPRWRLNKWFLSDEGQDVLRDALSAGTYRIDLPEEGAWLVVVWLIDRRHEALALELVTELFPLAHRLRFYPKLGAAPEPKGALVRIASIRTVRASLERITVPDRILAMNEALLVWGPLYDELVSLWLETVEGPAPTLVKERVVGGWPGRRIPRDWPVRRTIWLTRYRGAASNNPYARKHRHPKSNFRRLVDALERCPKDTRALSARDVGWIRRALANTIARWGLPGSAARAALRERQRAQGSLPTVSGVAQVVSERLRDFPEEGGLPSLALATAPVTSGESNRVPEGTPIPPSVVRKASRALEAPVSELVEQGLIASAEVLAQVLPQITAQVNAAGLEDRGLRELFGAIYAAFRRRRSVLLLNLEHQVQLDELPWIQALERLRVDDLGARELAVQTLEQVSLLAMSAFPQTILPNPLVAEMRSLAQRGGLTLPFVEEIAADIFMGRFTKKWADAAEVASRLMDGTLYGRYFDLPRAGASSRKEFAYLCRSRADDAGQRTLGRVAANGATLEQSQILTTHNLAVLVDGLGLESRLRPLAPHLALSAFNWAMRRQADHAPTRHAELIQRKNVAYAWRQGVFFLSFCPKAQQLEVIGELHDREPSLTLAVLGLQFVAEGGEFDRFGLAGHQGCRLLGWV